MLASPATVAMSIGPSNHFAWNASAGVSIGQVSFPQQDAQIPFVQILRGGKQDKSGYGSVNVTKVWRAYLFHR
jgi:glucan endo-1,3-alpha-glucosidase